MRKYIQAINKKCPTFESMPNGLQVVLLGGSLIWVYHFIGFRAKLSEALATADKVGSIELTWLVYLAIGMCQLTLLLAGCIAIRLWGLLFQKFFK